MAVLKRLPNLNLQIELPKAVINTSHQLFQNRFFLDHLFKHDVECLSDLEKLQILGSGNGGTVYQVCHKQTRKLYALKLIRGCHMVDDKHIDQLVREIAILRSCTDSHNIVRCHGVFEESYDGDIAILMEYMDMGSLDNLLKSNGSFSEPVVAKIAYQALSGLEYLHGKKIVHRDIKPGNLLVNREMRVKIADFGVSKSLQRCTSACQNTYVGTCAYMSPERFDTSSSTSCFDALAAGDVWSLGLTLVELFLGRHPYVKAEDSGKMDNGSLMWEIVCCDENPVCMPYDASEDFEDFVSCCLQKDWTKRWTASQLLSHPFVTNNGN